MKKFVGLMVLITEDGEKFLLDAETFCVSEFGQFFMDGMVVNQKKENNNIVTVEAAAHAAKLIEEQGKNESK